MRSKTLADLEGERTLIVVLDPDEEVSSTLAKFARVEQITGASFSAIGAFSRATLGWFDFAQRKYSPIEVDEQCEALSVLGDIASDDHGAPSVHIHAVVGLKDGSTRGGHLLKQRSAEIEITITEVPTHLRRCKRPALGIALIDLNNA